MKKQWWKTGWAAAAMLAMLMLNSSGIVYAEETGMTWGVNRYNNDLDITFVHCYGQQGPNRGPCNPYQGDTSCSVQLPVLCVKVDGSARPPYEPPPAAGSMNKEYYTGWVEGIAELTSPVQGNEFATLDDVNAYCVAQLGPGYRAAEFHDGRWVYGMDENNFYDATWPLTTSSGGWGFYAPGQLLDNSRFWVHINDQNANCWDSYAEPKGSIGDQVWADPDEDGNGLLDGDDYPLAGVNMRLYDSSGNLVRETETYVNGKYLFSNLDYETYSVEIDQASLPSNMQGNLAYDPDGGADGTASVIIDASSPNNNDQDFAVYVPAAPRDGMTWALRDYSLSLDISYLACYGQSGSPNYGPCNPYQGDSSCSVPLPVLCLKVDGSPRPPYTPPPSNAAMNKEYYHGWAEGFAELTAPIQGNAFATLNDVNAYCEAQLGQGYRAAEFHDGRWVYGMDENNFYDNTWPQNTRSGGWGFYTPGQFFDDSRFWVHINDQDANCWDRISPTIWTLSVNSSGESSVAITGNPSDYDGTTDYSKTDIADGSIITLTAPAAGGESTTFTSWSGCNATNASARTCTVTMSADKTVTASFEINSYTVTSSAGEHGSISPDSAQSVDSGSTTGFTVTPDTGYSIDKVEGCGGSLNGNVYTTGAITGDCTVTAGFVIKSYKVTSSAGANGSISPNSPQNVDYGNTTSFTLTPDPGYGIDNVSGCNGSLNGNVYTTGTITANCAVTANFITAYTVIPKARRHGSIVPNTPQQVSEGHTTSFTIIPDTGYSVKRVRGCDGILSGNVYTTASITRKCRVKASFKRNPVVISVAKRHGSIEPSGRQAVNAGTVLNFTVTPDAGYFVKSVSGCGGNLNGNVYTTDSISRKCKVKASFNRER